MTEFSDFENRITAAMDRITHAVAGFSVETGPSEEQLEMLRAAEEEIHTLRQALETEHTANAQLRERIAALKALKDKQHARIAQLEAEENRLRATQAADRAELDELIAALGPLIEEQSHA
ncbi:MAG: hypothetical protein ABNH26_14695 [Celeribacter sp.]|jgi:septal ring factor EnvC (AmiA/AmiB activator)